MTVGRARRDGGPAGVEVSVTDGLGRRVRDPGIGRWLERVAPSRARGAVAVALVGDGVIRRLNRRFAAIDRVTDVLSFPAADSAGGGAGVGPSGLGDIVIGVGRARRQAAEAGHSLRVELRLLALHGLLHLLGYDHHGDGGRMARVERRLRRRGGLAEGLLERAGRP